MEATVAGPASRTCPRVRSQNRRTSSRVLPALFALPGQPAPQSELAPPADRADRAYIGHPVPPTSIPRGVFGRWLAALPGFRGALDPPLYGLRLARPRPRGGGRARLRRARVRRLTGRRPGPGRGPPSGSGAGSRAAILFRSALSAAARAVRSAASASSAAASCSAMAVLAASAAASRSSRSRSAARTDSASTARAVAVSRASCAASSAWACFVWRSRPAQRLFLLAATARHAAAPRARRWPPPRRVPAGCPRGWSRPARHAPGDPGP